MKKLAIIGDSYSTYEGHVPEGYFCWYMNSGNECENDMPCAEKTWWYQLSKENDLEIVMNCSFSGSAVCYSGYPDMPDRIGSAFISRMKVDLGERRTTPEPDILLIFGGTNDFGHGDAVFGTTDDRTEDSFCGAVRCLCEYLLEKYPAAKLVFITPLHRWNEADPCGDKKPQPVGTLKEYVQALRAILEEYSIPVLDLYATSGIQPSISAIKARYMPDGLHPSDLGNELICDRLIHFMELL